MASRRGQVSDVKCRNCATSVTYWLLDSRQYAQQAVVPIAPQPGDVASILLLGRDHGEALAVAISEQAARGGDRSVPPHERRGC